MKKIICIALGLFFLSACQKPIKKEIEVIDFAKLQNIMEPKDDKVYVYNFWATWCAPCVKELPHFDKVIREYDDEVKLVLISQDEEKTVQDVQVWLDDRMYKAENYLLKRGNPNVWMPMIDESWSGAIPATMIKKGNKSVFFEGKMSEEQLKFEIEKIKK